MDIVNADERLAICKACDQFVKLTQQCAKCFCFMPAKVKFEKLTCPLDKWKEETEK